MSDRIPTGKTYRLVKISDLLDIPQDAIDDAMADIRESIDSAHRAKAALEAADAGGEWEMAEIIWTDDGQRTVTAYADVSLLIPLKPEEKA